jgi:hypothetical protein
MRNIYKFYRDWDEKLKPQIAQTVVNHCSKHGVGKVDLLTFAKL